MALTSTVLSRALVALIVCAGGADAFFTAPVYVTGRAALRSSVRAQRPALRQGLAVPARLAPAARSLGLSGVSMQGGDITADKPLKVAIAGGGVGGLFLAKALQNKGIEVQILEKTSKFARFGGPIQLASNALATIKGIDEGVFERVMSKFTFTGTRMNGIKDGIRTEWYTKFEAITKLAEYFKLPYTGVIDRPDLQEIMLEEVGGDKTVRTDSTFQSFEQLPNNEGVRVTLADGTVVEADILVGCDGIWSAVRSQLWKEPAKGPDSGCTYSGYTCFAADTVQRTDYYFDVGYQVYIGPGKYFVTSDVGRGRTQWYAFLALPPGSKSRASNKEYLYDLFSKGKEGRWTDELFKVLDATPDDAIEQRDLYDRPPSVLKPWSKGHVTLMGDAVHPMMPNLGQGGGQAIEDAYVLAERLGALKSRSQIPGALTGFYLSRLPRTAIVQGLSRIASDLIVSAFDTPFQRWCLARLLDESYQPGWVDDRYGPLGGPWGINNFFSTAFKPFMSGIFYAQFGYLYTFAPKQCSEAEIDRLVDEVMTRHKVDAEATWVRAGMMSQAEIDELEGRKGAGLAFRAET